MTRVRPLIGTVLRSPVEALRPLARLAGTFVREVRALPGNKQAQKNLTRALIRANAFNGAVVAVVMPLHGGRFETPWRFVVGLTLLMIVLDRALFEWIVPRPANLKTGRDWPVIPIFFEEAPAEPVNLDKYTGRDPGAGKAGAFRLDVGPAAEPAELDVETRDRGSAS